MARRRKETIAPANDLRLLLTHLSVYSFALMRECVKTFNKNHELGCPLLICPQTWYKVSSTTVFSNSNNLAKKMII